MINPAEDHAHFLYTDFYYFSNLMISLDLIHKFQGPLYNHYMCQEKIKEILSYTTNKWLLTALPI